MKRIDQLEGLRGLLAIWVVVVHLLPASGIEPEGLGPFQVLFNEKIRVQIFCIMSGFVIFMMMAASHERYGTYLKRRIMRIYPAFMLAFVLSILTAGIAYQAVLHADFESVRNAGRLSILDESFLNAPWHVIAHATLIHGLIPEEWLKFGSYAFLGQGWNVSTEFQFYLIAPIVFFFLHQPLRWLRVLFVAASLAVMWKLRFYPNGSFLVFYALYFVAGIVTYYLWKRKWQDRRLVNPVTVIAAAVAAGAADPAISGWIFVFGFAVLIRDQKQAKDPVTRFLEKPAMTFLGTISYSLYLLHMVPLYCWMYLLNGQGLSQPVYFATLTALTFATAIPLAMLSQKYVEQAFYASKTHRLPEGHRAGRKEETAMARR
jgi:peptidoglycan/LPS O-acetylase OafA/YrhL